MKSTFPNLIVALALTFSVSACSLWEDEPAAPQIPPPVGVTPGQPGFSGAVTAPEPQVPTRPSSQTGDQPALHTAPVGTVTTGSIPQSTDPRNFAPPYPVRMAFIWYDVPGMGGQDFFETRVHLQASGNTTRMSFPLAYLGIGCEGLIQYDSGTDPSMIGGEFRISCNDGSTMQGVIVPVAGQPAINGQGVDQYGRSVIFAIQMDEG